LHWVLWLDLLESLEERVQVFVAALVLNTREAEGLGIVLGINILQEIDIY
jgi:hypothetical protein